MDGEREEEATGDIEPKIGAGDDFSEDDDGTSDILDQVDLGDPMDDRYSL